MIRVAPPPPPDDVPGLADFLAEVELWREVIADAYGQPHYRTWTLAFGQAVARANACLENSFRVLMVNTRYRLGQPVRRGGPGLHPY